MAKVTVGRNRCAECHKCNSIRRCPHIENNSQCLAIKKFHLATWSANLLSRKEFDLSRREDALKKAEAKSSAL